MIVVQEEVEMVVEEGDVEEVGVEEVGVEQEEGVEIQAEDVAEMAKKFQMQLLETSSGSTPCSSVFQI